MNDGKGSGDFDAYVRNLQQALTTAATGRQFGVVSAGTHSRSSLVHNPYSATIAQMGIVRFRVPSTTA